MPFSTTDTLDKNGWTRIFDTLFKPTIELFGLTCHRSNVKTGSILDHIVKSIHDAAVVLADITDSRPNVFYELGIAHTISDQVVMVSQRIDECPSDLKQYGIIPYSPQPSHNQLIQFQSDVKNAMVSVFRPETKASPVSQYLGRTLKKLERELATPVASMECGKCRRKYDVKVGETTQSDFGLGQTDNLGRRTHPVGVEHQIKRLCGHWEYATFKGLVESK
jgi:hypothetical protein